jgi:hypothetical protein
MKTAWALLVMCLTAASVGASVDPPLDLVSRARGATKVILATVIDTDAAFGENEFGDQLILTHVTMQVSETMKGAHETDVVVTIEGGTIGDLTLDVSDMPKMTKGQRAVLFLTNTPSGTYVPHRRGSSVMEVDADDKVTGTGLTVDELRAAVKSAPAAGGR